MNIPLIFICILFISCSSNNNETKKKIKDYNYSISENRINLADTSFNSLLFDTTLVFNSTKELSDYKRQLDEKFKAFNQKASPINRYIIDSIKKLNEDLYTLLAFRRVTNTKQDIFLLLYNIDFSNLVSINDRMSTFNSLPEQTKDSKEGKFILERLKIKYKNTQENIGLKFSTLRSFQLLDSSRKNYLLSDLLSSNHKYTLIIFSASWCAPCRYEALSIKSQISKIDQSQLQIITISLDNDLQKWKKAIITDACPWMQFWIPEQFDSDLTKALHIKMIPTNLLINKQQEVIAQNTNVNEIFLEFPNLYIK
jgi:peroxiredoxin